MRPHRRQIRPTVACDPVADGPVAYSTAALPSAAVTMRGVSKVHGDTDNAVTALRDIHLDLYAGEFTAIMGPSGSGKSTLLNLMAGLDTPSDGQVVIGGTALHTMDDTARTIVRRSMIGVVFQAFNLVPTLTALENIELPFQLAGREIDAQTKNWIAYLAHDLSVTDRLDHRPAQLSGGQQQRIAIARALASRPAIILADEPTGSLDSVSRSDVLRVLTSAAQQHRQGIAMVTHDPVAAASADRIVMLRDGAMHGEYRGKSPSDIASILVDMENMA